MTMTDTDLIGLLREIEAEGKTTRMENAPKMSRGELNATVDDLIDMARSGDEIAAQDARYLAIMALRRYHSISRR